MRRICSPNVRNAFVAWIGISAIIVSSGIEVRAEDCLAAPNAASPSGQHWYYRIDRATRRHCWYLHAAQRVARPAHHEAAPESEAVARPESTAPAFATAAPVPAMAAAMPSVNGPPPAAAPAIDDAPSQPQVTALAVKTIVLRPPGAQTETRSRRGANEATIQQASAQAYRATPERKSDPTLFFFVVFGLGLMTFLTAIVIKLVAPQLSWPLRPARSGADVAWPQERRHYSGAGPMRLKSRAWSAH